MNAKRPHQTRARSLRVEVLEPRRMLATGPLITEFLASNDSALDDGDGNSSDWVELYNPTGATIDLSGWHLTDNANNLDKWTFPNAGAVSQDVLNLEPGEFLVVFASGQATEDYIDAGGNLYTDFRLSASGEYLALVQPGGVTVEHEFSPEYPPQMTDVSYGLSFDETNTALIAEGADAKYIVPSGPINGWNELGFDDSGWSTGATGIGYETSPADFAPHIETTVSSGTDTVYLRQTFQVPNPAAIRDLTLKLRFDDGYLAYLNGELVSRLNHPGIPQWNSNAEDSNPDSEAVQFQSFDLSDHLDDLVAGDNVLAIHALNTNFSSDMLIEAILEARVGSLREPLDVGVFLNPTPRKANGEAFLGVVDETTVSVNRGFYDSPFSVDLVSPTPGATLIYTTDGSKPSLSNGVQVLPPNANSSAQTSIVISTTTSLRTAAFLPDYATPTPTTHTYVFVDDVITSSVMDTSITQDPQYAPFMRQALLDIPTVSFNFENEIINSSTAEQLTSFEWLAPDGSEGFQVNAGIHAFGGFFNNFGKSSLRLHFRSRYGASRLDFPLFEGFDRGIPATDSFDQLNFRSGSHDMVQRGFYMSNRFVDDTLLDLGHVAPHGRFVHIYVNGEYSGQYHMRERWNADFLAQYYGGEEEDYEAINGNLNVGGWAPGEAYDGEGTAWDNINALTGNYQALKQYVDMNNYIDYMLIYMAGASENEYRSGGSADGSVPYTFFHNDADGWLRDPLTVGGAQGGDKTGDPGPANILGSLVAEGDPDFMILLADRIQNMFFNDGVLTPQKSVARLQERLDEIELSFLAESARRGFRTPSSWVNAANDALNNILPPLAQTMINRLTARGLFPTNSAPVLSQHGGVVHSGFQLQLSSSQNIYYTLDGSDPRLPGGTLSPSAILYNGTPITITSNATLKTRSLQGPNWSPINEATFLIATPADFEPDGDVDADDLQVWQGGFGTTTGATTTNGDTDADGDVDGRDFLAWQRNYTGTIAPIVSNNLSSTTDELPETTTSLTDSLTASSVSAMQTMIFEAATSEATIKHSNELHNTCELYNPSDDRSQQAQEWISKQHRFNDETELPEGLDIEETSRTHDKTSQLASSETLDTIFEEYFSNPQ